MSQTKIQNHAGPIPVVPWLKAIPESLKSSIEQTKVQYRRLGNSGLRISNPVLGAMSFGDPQWLDWVLDEEKALPLLKAAYDRGINTWDTANVYSNGASERIIGNALVKYNIPRHKVVIMTKCYRPMTDDMNPKSIVALLSEEANKSKEYVNQHGLSRPAIFRSVEASLRRLGTDYIDVLQIHRFDEDVPPEETMEALHDLVKSGKVHYIGASSMWTYQFSLLQHTAEKNRWTKFISMQNHYNLLYREEEREMNKYCKLTGVGLLPWSPLATGFLARPLSQRGQSIRSQVDLAHGSRFPTGESASDQEIIQRVRDIARKRGWPMSTVALAWLNKRVTAPIIGFSTVGRIDEALKALGKELTEEEERFLEEPYEPKEIQGHC